MESAVEFLVETLESMDTKSYDRLIQIEMDRDNFIQICEQAKEMERQQHNKTFVEGLYCESGDSEEFEKYFNRTFKQKEQ